jgi:hypothetical protein
MTGEPTPLRPEDVPRSPRSAPVRSARGNPAGTNSRDDRTTPEQDEGGVVWAGLGRVGSRRNEEGRDEKMKV